MTAFRSSILAAAILACLAPASGASALAEAGAETRIFRVGIDLAVTEGLRTGEGERAQLLFLDGSSLSVGPDSEVVVDAFSYDPSSRQGAIAVSASRGVFRLIGGQISKTTPIVLRFPDATIGVRGGIAVITAEPAGVSAAFVYGVDMVVEAQGEAERVERPGSLIRVPQGEAPQPPTRLTSEEADAQSAALDAPADAGAPGESRGGGEDVFASQFALSSTFSMATLAPAAGQLALQSLAPQTASEVQEASQTERQEGAEGLRDAVRYSGRLKRLVQALSFDNLENIGVAGALTDGGFFGSAEDGAPFRFVFDGVGPDGTRSGVAAPHPFGGALPGTFSPIFGDPEFLVVDIFDPSSRDGLNAPRYFGFLGVPTPVAAIPTSGIGAWDLTSAFGADSEVFRPFGSSASAGTSYAVWDRGAPGASRSFLIPRLSIAGQGQAQVSRTEVVVGRLLDDASGRPFLQARLRGAGRFGVSERFTYGGIATADGGDGADFFGSTAPKFFVLESSVVDDADSVVSRGVDGGGIAPYYPIAFGAQTTYAPAGRTTRALGGFAAGFLRKTVGGAYQGAESIRASGSGVAVATDAGTNRASANFDFTLGVSGAPLNIRLGGVDDGSSAFIDDSLFAAIDRQDSGSTYRGAGGFQEHSSFVTVGPENFTDVLPAGVSFCACRHAAWGFLTARLEAANGDRVQTFNAPVVLGEIAQPAQFAAAQSATYAGHAFGSVIRGSSADATAPGYTAIGAFSLGVTFAPGQVSVTSASLTSFDGGSLSLVAPTGPQAAPNYTFAMAGSVPGVPGTVTAAGQGTFVGPGTPPGTTIGRIGGVGQNYQFELGYVAERPGAP